MSKLDLTQVNSIMINVVADKTGYPEDMLNSAMDLESDLGVDSIKRVEILSDFNEKLGTTIDYDISELSALRTIGDVSDYFSQKLGQ